MDQPHRKGRASTFVSAMVWLGCAVGASVAAGCASHGQVAVAADPSAPAGCACQANADKEQKPGNGDAKPPAAPALHTFGQALRGYPNSRHSPITGRGPA